MCEFCFKYGKGKKWYLQKENYSKELMFKKLTTKEKSIGGMNTRIEWIDHFFDGFMMPVISKSLTELHDALSYSVSLEKTLHEDEIVERRKIEHFGQVLPIEDAIKVIDIVDSITLWPCGCRYVTTGKREYCCFGLGIDIKRISSKFPDCAFVKLEKEEAKRIICKYDEEGMIHTVWTSITPYITGLCTCNRNCLGYDDYVEKGGAPSFFRAEYICQIDQDKCTGCQSCIERCLFNAISYSSSFNNLFIDPTKCFGCGLCRVACINEAIKLTPRQEHPEAANIWLKIKM